MSPALPCNIQRFLHPVNQPENEVSNANGSAGRLLPFSLSKFLSCLLFFFLFNLAISVARDSFTLEGLSFPTIFSVVFPLWILQMFSVLFVHFKSTGHSETSLDLPPNVLGILQSKTCNPKEIVDKFIENLKLEHTSLEQPKPETRKWIRCLARNANCLNRLDVVKYLRQITAAGATGRCDTGIAYDDDYDDCN